MDKKRILVFTESYLPSVGGLENNTLLLCKTISQQGHTVTLITPQKNAITHDDFLVINSLKPKDYFRYISESDIFIVNGGVSFKAILPCFILNKPYLIIYQMASLFNHVHSGNLKVKLANRLRKYLAHKAKLNIGVSHYSFRVLSQIFGEAKATLLTNPAHPIFESKEQRKRNNESFDCLFAGRFIEGKGIKLLIAAIEILRKEGHAFTLHLIGEGPLEDYIENKQALGYIHLYPPTSAHLLKNWFHKVDLTVIPSTSHIEGSPLVMAESLVAGTPVLVSNQPAMLASVNHENMYFNSGDLNNLIYKLREMLNPRIYEDILKQTELLAQEYTYSQYFNRLEKIIHD